MRSLTILILFLLFNLSFGTLAQADDTPLFMIVNNYLWSWTPGRDAPQQIMDRFIDNMVVSPDGKRLAFMGTADITLDAIRRTGGFGGGGAPTDIWLLNIATGVVHHIAQQPHDASFLTQGVEDKALSRSTPVWSPDGTKLSWAELVLPGLEDRIVIYDVASNRIETTMMDIPSQIGIPTPLELKWGEPGILYRSWSINVDGEEEDRLILQAPDGSPISNILLDDSTRIMIDYGWIRINNQDFIGIHYNDDQWEIVHPYTMNSQPLVEPLQMYSTLAPDALSLNFRGIQVADRMWGAVSQDGSTILEGTGANPERTTLSPSGQSVAFSDYSVEDRVFENIVQVWLDGEILLVPEIPSQYSVMKIVWAPIAWRSEQDVSDLITDITVCPGFLPSRLIVDKHGIVLGSSANNVRSEPTSSSELLGKIPGGAVFTVNDGPVCADDLAWWQVVYEELTGWTAEGVDTTYWLEPVR